MSMRRGLITAAAAIAACTLWPREALAQLTAPHEAAQIEVGPLSVYPLVRIFDAGKDTNVFNEATNPKEDYTFTVNARVLAVLRMGENELLLSTGSDYVWYEKYTEERATNGQYAMRFNLSTHRLKPFVGLEQTRTSNRPNSEIDARARRLERAAVGGFDLDISDRTAITASARFDDSTYDEGETFHGVDLSEELNRRGQTFLGGVRYALTPLTSLTVAGEYSEDLFPESHVRDSDAFDVLATFDFSPDAIVNGKLTAGFEVFQPDDSSLSEYRGGVFAGALNWTAFNDTRFDLQANRGVSYSYLDSEPYYVGTSVRGSVTQPIFGPLELQGGGGWERLAYLWHRGATPEQAADDRADNVKSLSGGVVVNVRRGLRVGFTVEKTVRHSPRDPNLNYDRLRFMSSVILGS